MSQQPSRRATLVAVLALVACCALPALVAAGGGLATLTVGGAIRYWPLVVIGVVALSWGAFRVAALRHSQQRARSHHPSDDPQEERGRTRGHP